MLTPRQREVATLVARGMSYKAVARVTGLSPQTVKNHAHAAAERLPGPGSPRFKLIVFVLHTDDDDTTPA